MPILPSSLSPTQPSIATAVALSGQLKDSLLVPFAPMKSNEWISKRKLGNIHQYMDVFPECKFFWLGDSGQGDIIVGENLLHDDNYKKCVRSVAVCCVSTRF